ncbi:MAG TPA: YraN family protein [Methylomirabilota bacterium]|jgi:putative endonuclease|nr:YraN family protein [Methylomirabilota bacterium]
MQRNPAGVGLILGAALGYAAIMRQRVEKRDLGQHGERAAERFLSARGYTIVARNYRCAWGEVDLIVRDREALVFVEVRTHTGSTFGDPLESVTRRKQRQIAKAAMHYVMRHHIKNEPLRFDVIGICWQDDGTPQLSHVKGAFELPGARW